MDAITIKEVIVRVPTLYFSQCVLPLLLATHVNATLTSGLLVTPFAGLQAMHLYLTTVVQINQRPRKNYRHLHHELQT